MFKRAYISVIKNKGRTIIIAILLFVIANLVLASISIKTATEEAMDQARISLGPEITLTTDRTELFEYIKDYRDTYGVKPSQDEINELLVPITSDIAYGLAESDYVIDYNFSFTTSSKAVSFLPLNNEGVLDTLNESKISVIGTYNPLLLDQFGENGTYELTSDSSYFTGSSENEIIISESKVSEIEPKINQLDTWSSFKGNLCDIGTRDIYTIKLGIIKSTSDEFREIVEDLSQKVASIEKVSQDGDIIYIILAYHNDSRKEVEEYLNDISFEEAELAGYKGAIKENLAALRKNIEYFKNKFISFIIMKITKLFEVFFNIGFSWSNKNIIYDYSISNIYINVHLIIDE